MSENLPGANAAPETEFQRSMAGRNLNTCWPALLFDSVEEVKQYLDRNEEDGLDRENTPHVNARGVYGYQHGVTLMVRPQGELEPLLDPLS